MPIARFNLSEKPWNGGEESGWSLCEKMGSAF